MRITRYEAMTPPYPLLWWERQAGFGTRKMCRKQLRVADATAMALWNVYPEVLRDRVSFWETRNDMPVTTWVSLYSAVHDEHRPVVTRLLDAAEGVDAGFRHWFSSNSADAMDLLSWHLLWRWFTLMFRFALFSNGEGDEKVLQISDPETFALPHADSALVMLNLDDDPVRGSAFTGSLMGQALAVDRDEPWGPPPWNL